MGGGDDGYDVIVVGCGIAGLSAAVSAQQAGARVALLERAPKEERGGNTRYTESFWRMQSHDAVSEDFWDRFAENAGGHLDPAVIEESVKPYDDWPRLLRGLGFVDPELVATLADNAGPTLRWLTGFGVAFDFLPNYFITESTTRMAPAGGGLALLEALAAHAETVPDRIEIHYETTARRLIQDDEGRANGVEATGANNRTTRLRAHAVVLASGGFEGNPEMLSRYLGPQSQFIRPVARGGYYNRGEGIHMALEIGAAPCGDYGSFHAQPVDPRSGQHEPVVLNYPYGILVNREGRRFVDEAPATVDASYEAASRRMMAQTEGIAFAITDARLDDVPNWQKSVRTDQPPVEAETPAALAQALGVDGDGLARTLDAYNAACRAEDGFKPLALDGLATEGLAPRKSNWARSSAGSPASTRRRARTARSWRGRGEPNRTPRRLHAGRHQQGPLLPPPRPAGGAGALGRALPRRPRQPRPARPPARWHGRLHLLGKHGNAYVAKLVNNMLWKVHAAAIGEAMVAAKVAGLEPQVWWETMKGGAADSYVMHHDVPAVFAGHYDPSFPIALCLKDLDLIDELMRETGVRNDLIDATHARFREAGERYGLDAGDMTVCKLQEDDAGVELRVAGDWVASWEVPHPDDES